MGCRVMVCRGWELVQRFAVAGSNREEGGRKADVSWVS